VTRRQEVAQEGTFQLISPKRNDSVRNEGALLARSVAHRSRSAAQRDRSAIQHDLSAADMPTEMVSLDRNHSRIAFVGDVAGEAAGATNRQP
jgi:hypothetical protein